MSEEHIETLRQDIALALDAEDDSAIARVLEDINVTDLALLSSSNEGTAALADAVTTSKDPGEASIMARFGAFAVVAQVLVLHKGAELEWPGEIVPRNYVDEAIFAKLRESLGLTLAAGRESDILRFGIGFHLSQPAGHQIEALEVDFGRPEPGHAPAAQLGHPIEEDRTEWGPGRDDLGGMDSERALRGADADHVGLFERQRRRRGLL